MIQETKQLVLQDVCSRLPYGLRVRIYNHWTDSFEDEILSVDNIGEILHNFPIEDIKPYLRSTSSMTEDEEREFEETLQYTQYTLESYNWLNEHHFDYRLIDKGLAIEAKPEMYKI